ncbi:hypothetical protein E4U61_004342 [Claviceps capensis]|nr:hypothetical protein E4U61_004342 [Claviceps capensis]
MRRSTWAVSTLPDSPHFQFSGSKPVAVGQYADRLIGELDRDRAVKIRLFRDIEGESPPSPSRAAAPKPAPKPAAKPTTYASVASRPEGPTAYTLKTQRKTSRAAQRANAPPAEDLRLLVRLEPEAPTWDTDAYAIRRTVANRSDIPLHRVPAATRTKTGWAIKPTDAPTRACRHSPRFPVRRVRLRVAAWSESPPPPSPPQGGRSIPR